jgi:hypothetical protein
MRVLDRSAVPPMRLAPSETPDLVLEEPSASRLPPSCWGCDGEPCPGPLSGRRRPELTILSKSTDYPGLEGVTITTAAVYGPSARSQRSGVSSRA